MDTSKKQEILAIRSEISVLLEYLAQKVIDADADAENISYYFDYNDFDLFNAFMVFNHVWSSHAIHSGALTEENVHEKMEAFGRVVHDTYGIDTVELSKKVMEELNGTETEKNSVEK